VLFLRRLARCACVRPHVCWGGCARDPAGTAYNQLRRYRFDLRLRCWDTNALRISADPQGRGSPVFRNHEALVGVAHWVADDSLFVWGPTNKTNAQGDMDYAGIWVLSGFCSSGGGGSGGSGGSSSSSSSSSGSSKSSSTSSKSSSKSGSGDGGSGGSTSNASPRLQWKYVRAGGQYSQQDGLCGPSLVPVSEATACYCPVSRRAFVYGGWNDQFNMYGVSSANQACLSLD
jgi:hypothetical protein